MVSFTSQVSDVENKIGVHDSPVDESGATRAKAFGILAQGATDTVQQFRSDDKRDAIAQLDQNLTSDLDTGEFDGAGQRVATESLSEIKSLGSGIKQGYDKNAATLRAAAILKKAKADNPRYTRELEAYAKEVLGYSPYQEAARAASHDADIQQSVEDTFIKDSMAQATSAGVVAIGADGKPDIEKSIANVTEVKATQSRLAASKAQFEQNKITEEQHESEVVDNIQQSSNIAFENGFNNLFTQGIPIPGDKTYPLGGAVFGGASQPVQEPDKIMPLSELRKLPDERSKIILENAYTQFSTTMRSQFDTTVSSMGIKDPSKIKVMRENFNATLENGKSRFLGGVTGLEASKRLTDDAKNQSQLSLHQSAPAVAAILDNFPANIAANMLGSNFSSIQGSSQKSIKDWYSAQGKPIPLHYQSTSEMAKHTVGNITQAAANPQRLAQLPPEDVMAATPLIISTMRKIQTTPNTADPKADKVYLNYSANLAHYGKKVIAGNGTFQDVQTTLNEFNRPLWSQTFNAAKQRQGDAQMIHDSGVAVNSFLFDGYNKTRSEFVSQYGDALKEGKLDIRVDEKSGNFVLTSNMKSSQEQPWYKVGTNKDTHTVGSTPESFARAQSLVDTMNKTMNTMVGLKEFSDQAGSKDEDLKELIRTGQVKIPEVQVGPVSSDEDAILKQMLASEDSVWTAQVQQESGGKQLSKSGKTVTSSAGALGIAQILPETAKSVAKSIGVKYDAERLKTDPQYNEALGKAYKQQLLSQFDGNQTLALAAYNAGPKRVLNWIKRFGDPRKGTITEEAFAELIPYAETKNYVQSILANS